MSIVSVRWVFWVSLMLLAPLPFYFLSWGSLPVAHVLKTVIFSTQLGGLSSLFSLFLLAQVVLWSAFLWGVTLAYGRWSKPWAANVRGSITGLLALCFLILFSSVPVYDELLSGGEVSSITFLSLY